MYFYRLIQFIGLAVSYFRLEFLVLIGDDVTIPKLSELQRKLPVNIPTIFISLTSAANTSLASFKALCPDCPTDRLTVIYLSQHTREQYQLLRDVLRADFKDTHRLVLVRQRNTELERMQLANMFWSLNIVIAEFGVSPDLLILAWSVTLKRNEIHPSMISRFRGPNEIFVSTDQNAMVFRGRLHRWPGAKKVPATLITQILAPYHVIVFSVNSNKQYLVSSSFTIFQLIGEVLNYDLKIFFANPNHCPTCFAPIPLFSYYGRTKLHDYVAKVELST